MDNNPILAQVFSQNLQSLGREVTMPDPGKLSGSTDMGNVSQLVPSIEAVVGITSSGVSFHTSEFASAAVSDAGINGLIDGAKALAMTVVDLVSDSEIVLKIKKEFQGVGGAKT
jgi:metal-dependent amidase/aminoacylase/carboxypeptidase family protein